MNSTEPIAVTTGYYGGQATVKALDESLVLPVGLALYPQPAQQRGAAGLIGALEDAQRAINSMKVEAETAAQGDERMMLEACETISNEGLQACMAISAALASHGQAPAQPEVVPECHYGPLRDADAEWGKQLSVYATLPRAADTQQTPAQAAPAYKDSTPELHIGDSAFESWYSSYSPAHKSDKQRARDAYAAGMGYPLVTAAPENIRGILARCRDFIDTTKAPAYPAGADLADEIDVLLAAQPAPAAVTGPSGYGPKVTVKRRCSDCKACNSESYAVQGDSGHYVYCEHPSLPERKYIGDTHWDTPDWCPAAAPTTQPAPQQEAQEPAAVVVPCYTPSGKRVALYSAKQDLPIGTQLYTSSQPSPAAQGCALDVVLDAFENKTRGIPQAHIAAALVAELRAAIEAASTTPAAQEDALDTERLDFLIEHQAYVVSDDTRCAGYWLRYPVDGGTTSVQIGEYETPRAAIDAALAAQEGK